MTEYFDLNIEEVLEHWPVEFAVREIIANALDEAAITGTTEPLISPNDDGSWFIRDSGRGLRHEHLTQKEDAEKREHGETIGQFGMGLKDALAVFDRRGVSVDIRTATADITTARRGKAGFSDIQTLHAAVADSSDPGFIGTEVRLDGVTTEQIEAAKGLFLRYSEDRQLESTQYGQVLAKRAHNSPGRIYVRGILVATEPNFLFSYNITDLNKPLREALNRERSNVGRSAYTDRVKAILRGCQSERVAVGLTDDLQRGPGDAHDELAWIDVGVHACRVLASHEKVIFVTDEDLLAGGPHLEYARQEGYRIVTVPKKIADKLPGLTDLTGTSLMDLDAFLEDFNDSFEFKFIDIGDLTEPERAVYALTDAAIAIAQVPRDRIPEVLISETMQVDTRGTQFVGIYDQAERRIIIRRDQLSAPSSYCGTLLHEVVHATTPGAVDGSLLFQEVLTEVLGGVTATALSAMGSREQAGV